MHSSHGRVFYYRSNYSRICLMENNYWKTAELMNGRLAMMGLLAAVINYGFTGWIIPGFI
nr:chlorophyll a/b-binding protein [Prochlorococcus marinus]